MRESNIKVFKELYVWYHGDVMPTEKHRFPLRMSDELFNNVQKEAEKEMRSVNTFICIACREHLKRIKSIENPD
jgi:hypothetical protein